MKTNRKIRAKAKLKASNYVTKVIDPSTIRSGEIIMENETGSFKEFYDGYHYVVKELKLGEGFNFQIEDKKQPYTRPVINVEEQCREMAEEVVAHQIRHYGLPNIINV